MRVVGGGWVRLEFALLERARAFASWARLLLQGIKTARSYHPSPPTPLVRDCALVDVPSTLSPHFFRLCVWVCLHWAFPLRSLVALFPFFLKDLCKKEKKKI